MTHARFFAYSALMVLFAGSVPTTLFAQEASLVPTQDSTAYAISEGDISVQLSPENPTPFSQVVIRLTSNLIDMSRYGITWIVDGKQVASGIGMRTYQVSVKNYNQPTQVQAILDFSGTLVTKTIELRPGDATMLWEAVDSYVPPFYPGKKLPGSESLIRFTVLPNFGGSNALADAKAGTYRWERNGNVAADASGYGRNSFLISQNRVRSDESVTVTATDATGLLSATATQQVSVYSPHILFYERNAATGLRSPVALESLALDRADSAIVAEPYNFSIANGNPNTLSFAWTMNDQPVTIQNTKYPQSLKLVRPATSGQATLALTVTNPSRLLQTARNALVVAFMNN